MKYYKKAMNGVAAAIKALVAIAVSIMLVISFLEIIRRYCFGRSWAWSDELIRYLIVAVAFLGGSLAYRAKALPCFDLIMSKLPVQMQKVLSLIILLITAAMLVFLIIQTYRSVTAKSILSAISIGLQIPMIIPYSTIPAGFVLMLLFDVENIFDTIQSLRSKEAST